ncbi:protein ecdysoneless homolog [Uloborus diversus]|uniref:protein ecdysoneless homolog n=1 Tax=Uloborus diversus TaxID=327109 RepID=UPI002409B8C2|nr:protein ecdysoneless homolog [Uloborus diversus]
MAFSSQLPENAVKYKLFPLLERKSSNKSFSNSTSCEIVAETYISKLSGFLDRYIWQNESFNLRVVDCTTDSDPYLEGMTCFEENIDDEWFIVYLLYFLTQSDKDLVVQVQDSDGEFLLIEAAECLPKWINPDTSTNRIFIYRGELHIIPMAQNPGQITPIPSGVPSISNAVAAVRRYSSVTRASDSTQEAIQRRIKEYPFKIDTNKHRAHCYLPCSVAGILMEDPKLIPHAVKAFYLRDPLDLKACRAMKFFAPETRVMTEVVFTRCLYAQLSSQMYEPDVRTGWNLPGVNNPLRKAHELGMKLACGFEILASNADKMMNVEGSAEHDFCNDVRWRRFASNLKERGYFRGEIEGSQLYNRLMLQAKDFYLLCLKKDTNGNVDPGARIRSMLETLNINYDEMKAAEKLLKPPDSDSWMEITPDALDSMLEQMSHKNYEANVGKVITDGLNSFVNHRSDIEGAEIPSNKQKNKKQKINFDPDAFTDAVNTILDFRVPESDDDGSSSSMSGYSDEEEDDDIGTGEEINCKKGAGSKYKNIQDMKIYMEQMDRELAQTDVGLSFDRVSLQPSELKDSTDGNVADINEEEEDFRPVDVDLTALKNILESYSSQQGLPGPVSNLFSSMGLQLPNDLDS